MSIDNILLYIIVALLICILGSLALYLFVATITMIVSGTPMC